MNRGRKDESGRGQQPDDTAELSDKLVLELEQALSGLLRRINDNPDTSQSLSDEYASLLNEFAMAQPVGAAGIAAKLRVFLRDVEGNDYHGSELPHLIRTALEAAERLAAEEFDGMIDAFTAKAEAVLPLSPTGDMISAGSRAGGITADLVRRIYAAMGKAYLSAKGASQ